MDSDNTLDLSNTSGEEDLLAALGGGTPWLDDSTTEPPKEETPTEAVTDTTVDDTDALNAPADVQDEDISRVLSSPRVQAQLRDLFNRNSGQAVAEARQLWEAELARRAAEEEDLLLDDEEYGRRIRTAQKLTPQLTQAQQAGYMQGQTESFRMTIGAIWQIDELKALPDAEKATLDPADPKFGSYPQYVDAVINKVADVRARKLAEKMAKDMTDARVQSELSKFRKSSPSPLSVAGPSGGPSPIVDFDKMSGDDLFKLAFADKK